MTTITFEKIVPSGQAMTHFEERAWFCMGALPGETCEVEIVRQAKSFVIAKAVRIIKKSDHRSSNNLGPAYAPWLEVDYAYQLELKTAMLAELYARPSLALTPAATVASPKSTHYRNKLTFAITPLDGKLTLGMHVRGSRDQLTTTPDGCPLGDESLNTIATGIIERLNAQSYGKLATELVVRRSETTGEIVAVVNLSKHMRLDIQSLRVSGLAGLVVTVGDAVIASLGATHLTEELGGVAITYPATDFFQVNVPAFTLALKAITKLIAPKTSVLDLYGGAGAIGLPLAAHGAKVTSVEVNEASVEQANETAKALGLTNYSAITSGVEKLNWSVFDDIDTVVLDPPRAGLRPDVVHAILETRPPRLIYLSCDPATQARDAEALKDAYIASNLTGFDFYPGTPHLESLLTFTLK